MSIFRYLLVYYLFPPNISRLMKSGTFVCHLLNYPECLELPDIFQAFSNYLPKDKIKWIPEKYNTRIRQNRYSKETENQNPHFMGLSMCAIWRRLEFKKRNKNFKYQIYIYIYIYIYIFFFY
jgi:hypothetical protein